MLSRTTRRNVGSALGMGMLLVVTACAPATPEATTPDAETTTTAAETTTTAASETTVAETGISEERCAANRAAGRINFSTGFFFAAAAGIINVVAADELGYFEELCLDLAIRPGTATQNRTAVVAGEVQLTTMTSAGEAVRNIESGVPVTGIYVSGRVPIRILATTPDITELGQLEGSVIGVKGTFWPEIAAMLESQGVSVDGMQQVQVGFDPRIFGEGELDALPVFRSNEPFQLEQADIPANYFYPEDYGLTGSFGTFVARTDFANTRPTAVEDFLRAITRGFQFAFENPDEAVGFLEERSAAAGLDFNRELEEFRWSIEQELVLDGLEGGPPLGIIDLDAAAEEVQILVDFGGLEEMPDDVAGMFDNTFVEAIYDEGGELIWPAGD